MIQEPQGLPPEDDRISHMTLGEGMVRGLLITGTQTVREAQRIHAASPVATAALGRTLMGTAMISSMFKSKTDSVTVTIDGGGPIGRIVCVGDQESVRGLVDVPDVQLPLRPDGKLAVGAAVGHEGRMSVVKDLGMKSPYMGQVALQSGEIAEDFAYYFATSEQTPSLVSLGVLVSGDTLLTAGGILLQPMPDCPPDIIDQLELRSPMFSDLSREMAYEPLEALITRWLDGLSPVILETTPLAYRCKCSRRRMEKALIALGSDELTRMIADEIDGAELHCHFCGAKHHFSTPDLIRLLNQASE